MSAKKSLSPDELRRFEQELRAEYQAFKARGLVLDMTRGKPCAEQLDLSNPMLDCLDGEFNLAGVDGRNYGGIDGVPEAKAFFANFLQVSPDEVIVGGNSSLAMMHDTVVRLLLKGVGGGAKPWGAQAPVAFLCPCPGYDRHFAICETFGIDMIPVAMTATGPAMDEVERLVASDPRIKGMWCVPKYSNPTGVTFSDEVVDRLAAMPTAADDFRIFWDNAYDVHHLQDGGDQLKPILSACKTAGHADRVFIFSSTSKVTFAGAGLGVMGGSKANVDWQKKLIGIQTIGPNKLDQYRHLKFLKDMRGVEEHMRQHAAIIAPKFALVLEMLEAGLGDTGWATWSRPRGGYFVSLDSLPGCAARTVALAAEAGVKLTPAGATFPYGKDPLDRNIRLAPTFPPLEAIRQAMQLFVICLKLASIEKLLQTEPVDDRLSE